MHNVHSVHFGGVREWGSEGVGEWVRVKLRARSLELTPQFSRYRLQIVLTKPMHAAEELELGRRKSLA